MSAKTTAKTVAPTSSTSGVWHTGQLFWGLLLVLVGSLFMASSYGWLDVNFVNVWHLWPLLVIGLGLSTLFRHGPVGNIVMLAFTVISVGLIGWAATSNYTYPGAPGVRINELEINKTNDTVKKVDVNIKSGASEVIVSSVNQKQIVKSRLETNSSKISKSSTVSGDTQHINLTMDMDSKTGWIFGSVKNSWKIYLTRSLPVDLNVDTGASSIDLDLSKVILNELNINAGASSITTKLGDKQMTSTVRIESGASSVTLKLPKSVGIQVRTDNGLTSNSMSDLVKVSDNLYESSDYATNSKKINISTKIGAASFAIERY